MLGIQADAIDSGLGAGDGRQEIAVVGEAHAVDVGRAFAGGRIFRPSAQESRAAIQVGFHAVALDRGAFCKPGMGRNAEVLRSGGVQLQAGCSAWLAWWAANARHV